MNELAGIRAVTYDCWATLLRDGDPGRSMNLRVEALQRSMEIDKAAAQALLKEAWRRHDDAWKQTQTFGPGRMAACCLEAHGIADDAQLEELSREFEEASLRGGVVAADGAGETLEQLRAAGIRVGLVCDTGFSSGRVVRSLLEQQGFAGSIEAFSFSDEVGVPKPGREMFAKALAELGTSASEAVHIGDLKRTDIAGARDAGMTSVRYIGIRDDQTDAEEADFVIDHHREILELIGVSG